MADSYSERYRKRKNAEKATESGISTDVPEGSGSFSSRYRASTASGARQKNLTIGTGEDYTGVSTTKTNDKWKYAGKAEMEVPEDSTPLPWNVKSGVQATAMKDLTGGMLERKKTDESDSESPTSLAVKMLTDRYGSGTGAADTTAPMSTARRESDQRTAEIRQGVKDQATGDFLSGSGMFGRENSNTSRLEANPSSGYDSTVKDSLYQYVNTGTTEDKTKDKAMSDIVYGMDMSTIPSSVKTEYNRRYKENGAQDATAYIYNYIRGNHEVSGMESFGAGLSSGAGITSAMSVLPSALGMGEDYLNNVYGLSSRAQEAHPTAYAAGNLAGNMALMGGTGKLAGAGVKALAGGATGIAGNILQSSLTAGLTMGATRAIENAGYFNTGYQTGIEYASDIAKATAGGLAGGAVAGTVSAYGGQLIGSAARYAGYGTEGVGTSGKITRALGAFGLQHNRMANVIISTVAGGAFAVASANTENAINSLLGEEGMTREEYVKSILIGAAFGFISSMGSLTAKQAAEEGAKSYQKAQEAKAAGDAETYREETAKVEESIAVINDSVKGNPVNEEVGDAVEIVNSIPEMETVTEQAEPAPAAETSTESMELPFTDSAEEAAPETSSIQNIPEERAETSPIEYPAPAEEAETEASKKTASSGEMTAGSHTEAAARTFGENGQKSYPAVAESGKLAGLDEATVYGDYAKVYNAGRKGAEMPETSLGESAAKVAYNAGKLDSEKESGTNEGIEKRSVSDSEERGGRTVNGSTGGPEAVSGGTEEVKRIWENRGSPREAEADRLEFKAQKSFTDLGVKDEETTAYPVSTQDSQIVKDLDDFGKENGMEIVAVGGIRNRNGIEVSEAIDTSTGKTIVAVDDPNYTPIQLATHASAHMDVKNGKANPPSLFESARAKAEGRDTGDVFDGIFQYYKTVREGLSDDDVKEEMWADAKAGMNIVRADREFGPEFDFLADELDEIQKDMVADAKVQTAGAGAAAGGTKYSSRQNSSSKGALAKAADAEKEEDVKYSLRNRQLDIIQQTNPARDDIHDLHTWIRSEEDIRTFREVIDDFGSGDITPDFTEADVKKALSTGKITVYSSHPIENGNWVTPSRMEAKNYAGNGKVYSSTVNLTDVAWVDEVQGQMAKTDVKYSISSKGALGKTADSVTLKALQKENDRLKREVERIRADNTLTKVPTLKRTSVTQIARKLKKDFYGKNLDTEELTDSLMEIGNVLMTDAKTNGADSDTFGKMQDMADSLAREIVSEAVMKDVSLEEQFGDAVEAIRGTTFSITAKEAAGITDRAGFRKRNGKNIHFTIVPSTETARWDTQLDALANEYPGTVPHAGEVGARTPEELFGTLEEFFGNYGREISPFTGMAAAYTGMDTTMAVDAVSQQIMDSILFEARELHTKADRAKAATDRKIGNLKQKISDTKEQSRQDLKEAKAQAKEQAKQAYTEGAMKQGMKEREAARKAYEKQTQKAQALIQKTKERYEQKVAAEKMAHKAAIETMRYTRSRSEAEKTLIRMVKRINNQKLSAPNRAYFEEHFGDIDTVARSLTEKRENKVKDLEEAYRAKAKADPNFIKSAKLEQFFEDFHNKDKRVSDMTDQELADYIEMLREFSHRVAYQNKLIGIEDRKNTAEMALDIISDVERSVGVGEHDAFDIVIGNNIMDPMREVRRITAYNPDDPLMKVMNELNEGSHAAETYRLSGQAPLSKFTNDPKFMRKFDGKHADEIEIRGMDEKRTGKTVKITPSMRVSIYLHSLAPDNMRHMATGGLTVPDITEYKKGNMKEAFAHGTRLILEPTDVAKIVADMPAGEKEFARIVDNYFTNVSRPAIAETSEMLTGVPGKFVKGHYYPIRSDRNYTHKDLSNGNFMASMDPSISNPGWMKERVAEAKNPMNLFGVVDVFNNSLRQHADYVGLAVPLNDFDKLYGATVGIRTDDEENGWNPYGSSVRAAIADKWSTRATQNIEQFIDQLKGVDARGNSIQLLDKVRNYSAQGVLSLNASVAIKQTASYFTAAGEISAKSLAMAMNPKLKADTKFIDQMTPVFLLRKEGWNTTEMGDLSKSQNDLAKILSQPGLNWITDMDLATTWLLKRAAYFEAKEKYPDLDVGSSAFKARTAEIYNRVIENTQPNYNILHRSSVLRSNDSLTKILNMYKTQPYQNMNLLMDAIGEYRQKTQDSKAGEATKAEVKEAKSRMWATIGSQLVSSFVFALMQFAWDDFRGKTDKYKTKDGDWSVLTWLKGMGLNMAGNAFGMAPYLSIVPEVVETIADNTAKAFGKDEIFDATFYGYEVSPVEAVNDTIEAGITGLKNIMQFISDVGNPEENADAGKLIRALYQGIETVSPYLGLPLANVRKELQYLTRIVLKKAEGETIGQYDYLKLTGADDSDKYALLWETYSKGKDQYKELYSRMVEDGFDEKKISTRMDSYLKTKAGVDSVSDLDARYVSPALETEYKSGLKTITTSDVYSKGAEAYEEHFASEDSEKTADSYQNSMRQQYYELVTGSSGAESTREKIDYAGIDEADWILYKLALQMYDKKNEEGNYGTFSKDEKRKAVYSLDITPAQKNKLYKAVTDGVPDSKKK